MICDIMLWVCALSFMAVIVMLVRNVWVYGVRKKLNNERHHEYDDYLDYYAMVLKFWIWDIEKLKHPK